MKARREIVQGGALEWVGFQRVVDVGSVVVFVGPFHLRPPSNSTLSGTNGGASVHLQQGFDVLDEVELLVAGCRPEVVAHYG